MKSLRFGAQVIDSKNEVSLTVEVTETFYNVIDVIWNLDRKFIKRRMINE